MEPGTVNPDFPFCQPNRFNQPSPPNWWHEKFPTNLAIALHFSPFFLNEASAAYGKGPIVAIDLSDERRLANREQPCCSASCELKQSAMRPHLVETLLKDSEDRRQASRGVRRLAEGDAGHLQEKHKRGHFVVVVVVVVFFAVDCQRQTSSVTEERQQQC